MKTPFVTYWPALKDGTPIYCYGWEADEQAWVIYNPKREIIATLVGTKDDLEAVATYAGAMCDGLNAALVTA